MPQEQESSAVQVELTSPELACGRTPIEPGSSGVPVEDDAITWLSVHLRLPPGLPADDRPELVVLSRQGRGPIGGIQTRRLASQVWTSQPLERSIPSYLARTRHPARRGTAQVPVRGGVEEALVLLRSRYLCIAPVEVAPRSGKKVALEPVLGGYVAGRCILPREARERGIDGGDVDVELEDESGDQRRMECGEDGRFELWGLAPGARYTLVAHAPSFPSLRTSVRVEAGKRRGLTIRFELGGTVRGVVTDGRGLPVKGARVSVDDPHGAGPITQSDDEGRFELVGVPGGRGWLIASSDSKLESARTKVTVANGEVSNGLSLELTHATAVSSVRSARCGRSESVPVSAD